MTRRMFETGVSVYSAEDSAADDWADEGREEDAEAGALYFSTSSRIIRPEGPVPLTFARGIPRSRAIFFAIGEAKIRSPLGRSSLVS